MNIILASQSPRRRELLGQMGIQNFQIISPDVDESVAEGTAPADMVEQLSRRKAAAVAQSAGEDALIIAADTVVVWNGKVLGKPTDEDHAFAMLSALSGNRHQVFSGVTVMYGGKTVTEHEATGVVFRSLSDSEISSYIATGEPMDKAGAYGIQGLGALLVSGIEGDYFNVMGLPVFRLGRILSGFGLDLLDLAAH